MTAQEAVSIIQSEKTLYTEGFIGVALAEELLLALQTRYLKTNTPKNLTLVYGAGQGDGKERGLNHLGEKGLLKRVIGSHWNTTPRLQKLALENQIEAYTFPLGVICQMYRDIAAGRPTISSVGLHTFIDSRMEGGKLNDITTQNLNHVIEIDGKEYLKYDQALPDYAFIRGTYADEEGNISMEKECACMDALSIAKAVKNNGGIVIVQVEKLVESHSLNARLVQIPGFLVDIVVPVSDSRHHMQTFATPYSPALSGELLDKTFLPAYTQTDLTRCISRRCLLELEEGTVINLGIGISEKIALEAYYKSFGKNITFTIENGLSGGTALSGLDFGAMINPRSVISQSDMLEFYDGGGLDIAFLGMAQCDNAGNINASKFNSRIAGVGGFIDIAQNAKKIVFCSTFTTNGLEIHISDGKLAIQKEGSIRKFVNKIEQLTFNSHLALLNQQTVLYITERAVFELTNDGILLTEIAPGIDLQKDVLDQMDFPCKIHPSLKRIDASVYREAKHDSKV